MLIVDYEYISDHDSDGFDLQNNYLGGQGDLVTRLMMVIIGVTIWLVGAILTYLLSPPDPPSTVVDCPFPAPTIIFMLSLVMFCVPLVRSSL